MKRIIYIYALLTCFACANSSDKATLSTESMPTEAKEENMVDDFDLNGRASFKFDENNNNYQFDSNTISLINPLTQKLQELYDLQVLQQQHPEFKAEIASQLERLGDFKSAIPQETETIKIQDIDFIGSIHQINDSTFSQQLIYSKILNDTQITKDSILALIHVSLIEIDGQENINTTFTFKDIE